MELDLLTPKQAGKMLGKSAGTLAIWRCSRKYALKWVRLGNRIFYRRADLEEFIASCVVVPRDRGHKAQIEASVAQ